jgi:hypothetical protein
MLRLCSLLLAIHLVTAAFAQAESSPEAKAVVEKAIQATGGEAALAKFADTRWKSRGKLLLAGQENPFTIDGLSQGLDKLQAKFAGEFGGNKIEGQTVLNGDQGWQKFGATGRKLDATGLANEKRNNYLQVAPRTLLPLLGKDFTLQIAPEQTIDGRPVVVLSAKGPDGKDFTLSFDRETGLLRRVEADVVGLGEEEYFQETSFADYKEFSGIQVATKVTSLRDGDPFVELEYLEFKPAGKIEDGAFAEPK